MGEDPEATNLGTWKSYAGAGAGGWVGVKEEPRCNIKDKFCIRGRRHSGF